MSDSASRKSELQDASSTAQPGIGDLSALQSEIDNPSSNPHTVGDMKDVDAAANSDVLGDITLLEEAFAEMEDETIGEEDNIPMLHSTIEQPSNIVEEENLSHSIPVLEQEATAFVENSMPAANAEADDVSELAVPEELPLTSVFEPEASSEIPELQPIEEKSVEDEFNLSSLDNLADNPAEETSSEAAVEPVITTFDASDDEALEALNSTPVSESPDPVESIWSDKESSSEPNPATVSTIAANFDNASENSEALADISESKISNDVFTPDAIQSTIEDKIAQATGDNLSTGFNDIPLANDQISGLSNTELASGFVEDLSHSTAPSEYIPQTKESANMPKSMSIPFELHSQLSKKIDALVLDATMSLTSELENQLSAQLESLLGNAVESVLPKLIDQMANELRAEVNGRVKQQLPIIVNDVLGKTRLN